MVDQVQASKSGSRPRASTERDMAASELETNKAQARTEFKEHTPKDRGVVEVPGEADQVH